jgi:hypothetical protein
LDFSSLATCSSSRADCSGEFMIAITGTETGAAAKVKIRFSQYCQHVDDMVAGSAAARPRSLR